MKIQCRWTCINKIKKTIDFIFFWPIPEKNACDFSPCDNGGRCEVVNGTFFCHCPLGYTGDKCETGKMYLTNSKNVFTIPGIFKKFSFEHWNHFSHI